MSPTNSFKRMGHKERYFRFPLLPINSSLSLFFCAYGFRLERKRERREREREEMKRGREALVDEEE